MSILKGLFSALFEDTEFSQNREIDKSKRPGHIGDYNAFNARGIADNPREKTFTTRVPFETEERGWTLRSPFAKKMFFEDSFIRDYKRRQKVRIDEIPHYYQLNYEGMRRRHRDQELRSLNGPRISTWEQGRVIPRDTRLLRHNNKA